MRYLSALFAFVIVFAVHAEPRKAFNFSPPAKSPEFAILQHFREKGVDPDIRLSLIPARLQRTLRAKGLNIAPARFDISDADWPYVQRAVAQGPVEDFEAGAWVLEYPAQISNQLMAELIVLGQKQLGTRLFRRFVAAHELGHSTLRRIAGLPDRVD